jgi:MFS family permease
VRKWRALLILALGQLLALGLWFSATAVTPALTREWDLSGASAAWLTMSVQLGFVAGALGSAVLNLADRWSAPRLIAAGSLAGALATAAIPLLELRLAGAVALRFATGAALAAVYPVGMRLMATWTREDRGLGLGLLVGALTVGSASPHLLRGIGGAGDWQAVLYLAALLAAAGGLLVAATVRYGPYRTAAPRLSWRQFTAVVRERPLRLASFGYFGHMWELYAMWTWLPAFLIASYTAARPLAGAALAERFAALATFAAVAAGGPGSLLWGRLGDRWGRSSSTILSMAISGGCCLAIGLVFESPWAAVAVALLWGFTVVADSAQFSTAISELCEPEYTGTALSAQLALGFLLTMVSIQVTPLIAGATGWRWTFTILAPGPLLGIAAMAMLRRLPESARLAGGRG